MELMERTHRLFFALWPNDALRDRLAHEVASIVTDTRARSIPPQNFHITLAFLGAVQARRLPSVMEAASQVDEAPVELRLEQLEAWPGAHVLCLTPGRCEPLHRLVDQLRINLLAHHLEPDQKEFRPHVTIAREWRDRNVERRIGPFAWSAQDFVLAESETSRSSSQYRIIGRWPLTRSAQE